MLIRYLFLFLLLNCSAQQAPACGEILDFAQNQLPHWGILKSSREFTYVDVDDEYIHTLVRFLQEDGFEEPPYFNGLVGAHITVIYPNEGVKEIQDCGKIIYFTLKDCKVVHPPKWKDIDEVYFIVVESPELDEIRQKYGLPKREYAFHITIGVRKVAF